jgi:hypothetical protein
MTVFNTLERNIKSKRSNLSQRMVVVDAKEEEEVTVEGELLNNPRAIHILKS